MIPSEKTSVFALYLNSIPNKNTKNRSDVRSEDEVQTVVPPPFRDSSTLCGGYAKKKTTEKPNCVPARDCR
jgi:hypothetical protein